MFSSKELTEEVSSYGDYVMKLKERMEVAQEVARKHLHKAAQRQKEAYDAKSTLNQFKSGDLVWYASESGEIHITPKLRKSFIGPVLVLNKINDLLYRIQLNQKGVQKIVHHDKLVVYRGQQRLKWARKALQSRSSA